MLITWSYVDGNNHKNNSCRQWKLVCHLRQ
nr:MAG TPA: hypothetical protein [Caudoviricetes sp.]